VKTIKRFEYTSKMTVQNHRTDKLNMVVSCCEANTFLLEVSFTYGNVPSFFVPFTFPNVELLILWVRNTLTWASVAELEKCCIVFITENTLIC
jgi:hypothetical protein